ncbi:MAG: hypothetical protein OQJ80_00070 [Kangiella sp.]|nr:hypothetical protein [Kangiella sp.]
MNYLKLIAKSIKRYNESSFELKRFAVLFQKLNLYIIGVCLLIPSFWYNFMDEEFMDKRTNVFNYSDVIKKSYEDMRAGYDFRGHVMPNYETYFNNMSKRFYSDFAFICGSMAITALPWLLILFWPAGAPIRVDRKNGLIFTRQWFRFYAARLEQLQPECKTFSASLEQLGGPLIVSLYRPGKVYDKDGKLKRGMRIRIGCYIPPDLSHNRDILYCIEQFMTHEADIPKGLKPEKVWLEWSLVPAKKLSKQKKLDKKIAHWFAKENQPDS